MFIAFAQLQKSLDCMHIYMFVFGCTYEGVPVHVTLSVYVAQLAGTEQCGFVFLRTRTGHP